MYVPAAMRCRALHPYLTLLTGGQRVGQVRERWTCQINPMRVKKDVAPWTQLEIDTIFEAKYVPWAWPSTRTHIKTHAEQTHDDDGAA
jgi:hypothetical protein